jgi:hypothetical protein
LNARNRPLLLDEISDSGPLISLCVVPESCVKQAEPTNLLNSRCFGHDQTGTPHGKSSKMDQVPGIGDAVDR